MPAHAVHSVSPGRSFVNRLQVAQRVRVTPTGVGWLVVVV
jgi:hypothetical protein